MNLCLMFLPWCTLFYSMEASLKVLFVCLTSTVVGKTCLFRLEGRRSTIGSGGKCKLTLLKSSTTYIRYKYKFKYVDQIKHNVQAEKKAFPLKKFFVLESKNLNILTKYLPKIKDLACRSNMLDFVD